MLIVYSWGGDSFASARGRLPTQGLGFRVVKLPGLGIDSTSKILGFRVSV